MKHVSVATAVLAVAFVSAARAQDAGTKPAKPAAKKDRPVDRVPIPPLKPFDPPEAKRVELPNGIALYVLEDRELPIIELRAMLRAGSIWDPADKVGLAQIAGSVWRTGGTKKHPKEALDQLLEKHGAVLEARVGDDSGSIHLSVLKEDLDLGLSLLHELLTEPLFPKEKLEQAKRSHLAALERRYDEAPPIASRIFDMQVFGKKSPLARQEQKKTLEAITTDDLVEWHRRYVRPRNLLLGVYGDADEATLEKKVAAVVGGWKGEGDAPAPEMPLVDVKPEARWTIVEKDVNQSTIVIGHAGGIRLPDAIDEYARVICMNQILGGGGFTSRLVMNVRSDMGLAYSVYSRHGLEYDHPGTFQMVCQTKSETTVKAIKAMLAELRKIRTELCTEEELAVAKESILNQVPFWVDTPGKVMERALIYAYRGFPQDTLSRFTKALAKVTREDVLAAAKSAWREEALTAVVCGNSSAFDKGLEELGKIDRIDDPEAWEDPDAESKPAASSKAPAGGEATALMEQVVEAMGGKKALDALEAVHLVQTVTRGGQELGVDVTIAFPDKMRQTLTLPQGKITIVFDGKKGAADVPGQGVVPLPPQQTGEIKRDLEGQTIVVLKAAAAGKATATLAGEGTVAGKKALRLVLKREGARAGVALLVDPESKKLVGREDDGAQGKSLSVFEKLEPVGGVLLVMKSTKTTETEQGEQKQSVVVTKAEANPKVDAKAFVLEGKKAPADDDDK